MDVFCYDDSASLLNSLLRSHERLILRAWTPWECRCTPCSNVEVIACTLSSGNIAHKTCTTSEYNPAMCSHKSASHNSMLLRCMDCMTCMFCCNKVGVLRQFWQFHPSNQMGQHIPADTPNTAECKYLASSVGRKYCGSALQLFLSRFQTLLSNVMQH